MRGISSLILNCMLIFTIMHMSGCASLLGNPNEIVDYQADNKQFVFSKRDRAEITKMSPQMLNSKNYVKIGTVNVAYTIEECESKERKNCHNIGHDDTSTIRALKEAADRGGDLVHFDKQDEHTQTSGYRTGKCLETDTIRTLGPVPITGQRCKYFSPGLQHCQTVIYGYESAWHDEIYCKRWENIPYFDTNSISAGVVWRYDPDYIKLTEFSNILATGNRTQVKKVLTDKKQFEQLLADGETFPINQVISHDNIDALKVMLELGMHPVASIAYRKSSNDNSNMTISPTELAAQFKAEKCLKLLNRLSNELVKQAFDANHPSSNDPLLQKSTGKTNLWWAAFHGNLDEVNRLIKRGENVNAVDNNGESPLVAALVKGHYQVVQTLLKNGADRSIRNKDGKTALEVTRQILEYAKNSPQPEFIKNLEAIVHLLSH